MAGGLTAAAPAIGVAKAASVGDIVRPPRASAQSARITLSRVGGESEAWGAALMPASCGEPPTGSRVDIAGLASAGRYASSWWIIATIRASAQGRK